MIRNKQQFPFCPFMKLHRSEPLHTRDRDRARNTQNSAATPNRTAMPHTVAAIPKIPFRAAIAAAIHNIV
jgi:hypothetical protein